MFDNVELMVRAGSGGDGMVSFRHEKYVPFGGPDGGDGGDGGDVVLFADSSVSNLLSFRNRGLYRAGNGESGRGKKQHGKNGADLVLRVPPGTIAINRESREEEALIADCEQAGQRVVLITGGRGGLGNVHYASSTNQAPRIAQKGEVGEGISIILELRLIADVGIIGYPNVGKSTLLATASAAKPKIASYPFTTLQPVLGVVEVGYRSFVMAEIPGLIDGAHQGRGLGHDFLRHSVRTKMLIHVVDGDAISPVEDMVRVNTELGLYDAALAQKPQLVVINKIDLPQVRAHLDEIKTAFSDAGIPVLFISAAGGEGVAELVTETMQMLSRLEAEIQASRQLPRKVFRPQPRRVSAGVHKEGETFVVVAPELERIVARVDMNDPEVRGQVRGHLTNLGISKALSRAGVKPGDKVRCGGYEWEW